MENLNNMQIDTTAEMNTILRQRVAFLEEENTELKKNIDELINALQKQQNVACALEFIKSYAAIYPDGAVRHDGKKIFSTMIVEDPGAPSKRCEEVKRWHVFIREL